MTSNTIGRKKLQFLGYNLGTYGDCDGDFEIIQFMDWRPGGDTKYRIPNSRGNELMLVIDINTGEVTIQDYDPGEGEGDGGWTILAKITWRELIGHPTTPTSPTLGDHTSTTSSGSAG